MKKSNIEFNAYASGFSIIEMLISVAISSVLVYTFAILFQNQLSSTNTAEFRNNAESQKIEIMHFLRKTNTCTINFTGHDATAASTVTKLVDSTNAARFITSSDTSAAPTISNGMLLDGLVLSPVRWDDPADMTSTTGVVDLEINLVSTKSIFGPKAVTRKVSLYIEVNDRVGNLITNCSSFPEEMGGFLKKMCVTKRSGVLNGDGILWCPATNPSMASCSAVDNKAGATPADLTGHCPSDGSCSAIGNSNTNYNRSNLGSDFIHTEKVMKIDASGAQIEGCFTYDENHSHANYIIDILCCR